MNDFAQLLSNIDFTKEERIAIATIINLKGSSYRKVGAKMLFFEDGRRYGTVSAGCLEDDLFIHALEALKTNSGKIITYNLLDEDDMTWGVGCNGEIDIYIEPILNNHYLAKIKNHLNDGKKLISLKTIVTDRKPENDLFSPEGERLWQGIQTSHKLDFQSSILPFIASNERMKIIHLDEKAFLLEKIEPKPHLYIFGAGVDVEPLVKLASNLNFVVAVIDPRQSRCNKEIFPTADYLFIEHPITFFTHNKLNDDSFVVIMNHHFQRDQQILEYLSSDTTAYIGILGSKKRTEKLLHNLDKPLPKNLFYPIGLKIGAEGPEEISVSIMAEIIQVRHQLTSLKIP